MKKQTTSNVPFYNLRLTGVAGWLAVTPHVFNSRRLINHISLNGPKVLNGIAPTQAALDKLTESACGRAVFERMRNFAQDYDIAFLTAKTAKPFRSDVCLPFANEEIFHSVESINGKEYLTVQRGKHRKVDNGQPRIDGKALGVQLLAGIADIFHRDDHVSHRAFDKNGVSLGGMLSDALRDMDAMEQKMPEVLDPLASKTALKNLLHDHALLRIEAKAAAVRKMRETKAAAIKTIDVDMPEIKRPDPLDFTLKMAWGHPDITPIFDKTAHSSLTDISRQTPVFKIDDIIFDSGSTIAPMTFERLHEEHANEIARLDATVGRAEVIPFLAPKESNDE